MHSQEGKPLHSLHGASLCGPWLRIVAILAPTSAPYLLLFWSLTKVASVGKRGRAWGLLLPTLVPKTLLSSLFPSTLLSPKGPAMGLLCPPLIPVLFQQPEQFNGQNNTFSGSSYSSYSQGSVNRVSAILVLESQADPQQVSAGGLNTCPSCLASQHVCRGVQVEGLLLGHMLRHRYAQDLEFTALLGDQGQAWALQKIRQKKDPWDLDFSLPPAGPGNVD